MQTGKYYKWAALYPAIFSIVYSIINGILYMRYHEYKSEWLTQEAVRDMAILFTIGNAGLVCILSCTLLSNKFQQVYGNIIVSFFSWFTIPSIWIFILLSSIKYPLDMQKGADSETLFIFSNTLPYLAGLIVSFIRFRKDLKLIPA